MIRRRVLLQGNRDLGQYGEYLTFTAVENTTFSFNRSKPANDIYYSLDDGVTWTILASNSSTPTVTIGNSIKWKGEMQEQHTVNGLYGVGTFDSSGKFNCSGNVTSLIYGDSFISELQTEVPLGMFAKLFMGSKVVSCENIALTKYDTNAASFAYMFKGCQYLTATPEICMRRAGYQAMSHMFEDCTSLVSPSDIEIFRGNTQNVYSITELYSQVNDSGHNPNTFAYMFNGCTSLTHLPKIKFTYIYDTGNSRVNAILDYGVCHGMFKGCTSLTTIPEDYFSNARIGPFDSNTADGCYSSMFKNCTSLVTVPRLLLSSQYLSSNCYSGMFEGCTSLTNVPDLPATTLKGSCYEGMFEGCTSLTTLPTGLLPATTLAPHCYRSMFYGCTNLTTSIILPATTLATHCYEWMFRDCRSLTQQINLPATVLANDCYSLMHFGTNLIPDVSNIDFTDSSYSQNTCLSGLFCGTNITDSFLNNVLPKNNGRIYLPTVDGKVYNRAYSQMFSYCPYITIAPLLGEAYGDSCFSSMFYGCTSLIDGGTIKINAGNSSSYDRCYYMFGDCRSLQTVTLQASTIRKQDCYNMFVGCSDLQTVGTVNITSVGESGCYSMFYGCRSLTTAPILKAATLSKQCYQYMFYGCTSLQYIKCLATDISASNCTYRWTYNLSSTGTFVKKTGMSGWTTGADGIPTNWTIQDANS